MQLQLTNIKKSKKYIGDTMKHFLTSLFMVLLLAGCGNNEVARVNSTTTISLKAANVQKINLGSAQSYPATVEPITKVQISTRISGWVATIPVKEGDKVEKGQLLIKLRDNDINAKLLQAEAAISAATTHFNNTQTNLKRIERLFDQNAATQKELDDMKAAFSAAEAQLITAKQQKAEILEMQRYFEIRSPISGVITRKFINSGELATPGVSLLVVEDLHQVKVVSKVPETLFKTLTPGDDVWVKVGEPIAGSVSGKINRIIPGADPRSRQFDIEILLDNPGFRIQSGVYATVNFTGSGELGLYIPEVALFNRGQLEGVYLIDDGIAKLRWVKTGRKIGNMVEILSGLNENEQIVLEPTTGIRDGIPVEVTQTVNFSDGMNMEVK
jgi:RND family efflux transporter MFP subunit